MAASLPPQHQHSMTARAVPLAGDPQGAHFWMVPTMAAALKASAAAHRSSLGAWIIQDASTKVASERPPLGCPSLSNHRLMLCTLTCTAASFPDQLLLWSQASAAGLVIHGLRLVHAEQRSRQQENLPCVQICRRVSYRCSWHQLAQAPEMLRQYAPADLSQHQEHDIEEQKVWRTKPSTGLNTF